MKLTKGKQLNYEIYSYICKVNETLFAVISFPRPHDSYRE